MNVFLSFRELLPGSPLQYATVVSHTGDGNSTVAFPEGGTAIVSGASVPVLSACYVKDGKIEGPAPSVTPVEYSV